MDTYNFICPRIHFDLFKESASGSVSSANSAPNKPYTLDFVAPNDLLESTASRPSSVLGPSGQAWLQQCRNAVLSSFKGETAGSDGSCGLFPSRVITPEWARSSDDNGAAQPVSDSTADRYLERLLARLDEQQLQKLRSHQLEALTWALKLSRHKNMPGCMLGLEQGGGKTLIGLCLMQALGGPNLAVVPKTVISAWKDETQKWFTPEQLQLIVLDTEAARGQRPLPSADRLCHSQLILTTYDSILLAYKALPEGIRRSLRDASDGGTGVVRCRDNWELKTQYLRKFIRNTSVSYKQKTGKRLSVLFSIRWSCVLLDESHRIKGNGVSADAVCLLPRGYSCMMSGTFVNNSVEDLYPAIRFLGRQKLPDRVSTWRSQLQRLSSARAWTEQLMKTHLLRFKLTQLAEQDTSITLPPLRRWSYRHPFINVEEKKLYGQLLSDLEENVKGVMVLERSGGASSQRQELKEMKRTMLRRLMSMRRCAVGMGSSGSRSSFADSCFSEGSTKMRMLCSYLVRRVAPEEKVLIFCEWTSTLDLVERSLRLLTEDRQQPPHIQRLQWVRIDGSMNNSSRRSAKQRFKRNPKVRVFLISTRAGNTGNNLVEANHVLLLEPWYNPQEEEQALSRAWRPGQTQEVNVVWLLIRDTCEEDIYTLSRRKLAIADNVHDAKTIECHHIAKQKLPSLRTAQGIQSAILQRETTSNSKAISMETGCRSNWLLPVTLQEESRVCELLIEEDHSNSSSSSWADSLQQRNSTKLQQLHYHELHQLLAEYMKQTTLQPQQLLLQGFHQMTSYSNDRASICSTGLPEQRQLIYLCKTQAATQKLDTHYLQTDHYKAVYGCDRPLQLLCFAGSIEDFRRQLQQQPELAVPQFLQQPGSLSFDMLLLVLILLLPNLDGLVFQLCDSPPLQDILQLYLLGRSSKLRLLYMAEANRSEGRGWVTVIDMNDLLLPNGRDSRLQLPGALVPLGS